MINDKKFDFSEESDMKQALLAKLRLKFKFENEGTKDNGEMSDEDLKLVAGGRTVDCPLGGNCSACEKNKDGKCKL